MEMKINSTIIVEKRKQKAWSQQHLADVSGLSLRTVQRVENSSTGAPDTIKAIAMAFGVIPADLMQTSEPVVAEKTAASTTNHKPVRNAVAAILLCTGLGFSLWFTATANNEMSESKDPQAQTEQDAAKQLEIEQAAFKWLKLIDDGDYSLSWEQSDAVVRQQVTSVQWQQAVSQAKSKFGATISRQVADVEHKTALPGLPDGEYVILTFESQLENKAQAIETLPMSKASGEWRPIGYFIR